VSERATPGAGLPPAGSADASGPDARIAQRIGIVRLVIAGAVACLAGSLSDAQIHTFSGGFRETGYDETPYARIASQWANTIQHEIFATSDEFVDSLPTLVYHMDEPAAGPGLFPQYLVSQLASRHVKVVLGGQGGDEIFGGYTRYLIAYLEACIKGGIHARQLPRHGLELAGLLASSIGSAAVV